MHTISTETHTERESPLLEVIGELYREDRTDALDRDLNKLRVLPPTETSVAGLYRWECDLDSLGVNDYALTLSKLLGNLPPRDIVHHFGAETLAWTFLKYRRNSPNFELMSSELDNNGIESEELRAASITISQIDNSPSTLRAFDLYTMRMALLNSDIEDIIQKDELLQIHRKIPNPLSEKRLNDYSFEGVTLPLNAHMTGLHLEWEGKEFPTKEGNRVYDVYMDSSVGILLLYKGQPQAIVCFYPDNNEGFFINQIQGLQGKILTPDKPAYVMNADNKPKIVRSRGLAVLNSKELLLHAASRFAHHLGYSNVVLQSGINNKWIGSFYGVNSQIPEEKAIRIYDGLAKRYRAEKDENKNYPIAIKDIEALSLSNSLER